MMMMILCEYVRFNFLNVTIVFENLKLYKIGKKMKSMINSSQLSPCEAVVASLPDNGIEFGYCGVQ